ncbi:MAG: ADP-dependent NAD(P)H-hydrate dehydratase / NAD(P)H-hydrate epimerase [Micromonosporaceae bacterium]
MRAAWRVADVRAAEEALMARLPAGTLMQRAATALARRAALLLADRFGSGYGRRALLLVGAGNNGGDALYAGAQLARRGVAVRALLLDPDRAHRAGLSAFLQAGGRVTGEEEQAGSRVTRQETADIVLDGIVGIGGKGGLREPAAAALAAVKGNPLIVAVDVPSGVDADTGEVPGEAVTADVTVTFGCLKPGLVVGAGARRAGLVDLVDIGLAPWLRADPALRVPDREDISAWWPRAGADSDKYTRGVVGVATGSERYPGAGVLSVAGACAGPSGMVRYAGGAGEQVRFHHPSVIVSERVADAGRVQAWVCGSGLGTDERAAAELRTVLAGSVPVCLDADALNLLVDGSMAQWLRRREAPVVVTPHDREFARLAGAPPGPDRVESALRLAAAMHATVLLKGDRTVVAGPDGEAWVNPTGAPALATGGTGDVLAGLLGSLLAARLPPARAAVAAAYAHGLAGREAARHGPVTASDVAAALRPVVAGLTGAGTGKG